jgi:hypothetical protein
MRVTNRTALVGLGLMLTFAAPAWSGDSATPAAHTQDTSANPYGNSILGMLNSVLTGSRTEEPQPEHRCRPSELYSQHDVVGDPEACVMGRYGFGSGSNGIATGAR